MTGRSCECYDSSIARHDDKSLVHTTQYTMRSNFLSVRSNWAKTVSSDEFWSLEVLTACERICTKNRQLGHQPPQLRRAL